MRDFPAEPRRARHEPYVEAQVRVVQELPHCYRAERTGNAAQSNGGLMAHSKAALMKGGGKLMRLRR